MIKILTLGFVLLLAAPKMANAGASYDADEIVGFEVLLADRCDQGMECAMGHTFLRMVRRDSPAARDLVFGFTTTEGPPGSITGLIAYSARALVGLRLLPSMTSLANVYRSYVEDESRDLIRIPLQMTDENKRRMVENISMIFSPDSKYSRDEKNTAYNYLFDNCAGLLVKLLKDSGMPNESIGIANPMNVPAHLFRTYNALYPELRVTKNYRFGRKFDALPDEMYQFCRDVECALKVRSTFPRIWPGQEIEFPRFEKPDPTYERETLRSRSEPNDWNGLKATVVRHFELIRTLQN
jgi:hypothetical protein